MGSGGGLIAYNGILLIDKSLFKHNEAEVCYGCWCDGLGGAGGDGATPGNAGADGSGSGGGIIGANDAILAITRTRFIDNTPAT